MKDVLKHCYQSDFAIFLSLPTSFIFWCIVAAGVIFIAAFLALASSSEIAVVVVEVSEKLYS